jgi:arylsulfatase A-like enzyme
VPCLAALAALVAVLASTRVAAAQDLPPDVVVIVTDDQRWDTLWAMPTVQDRLAGRGVRFENAFVVNPICCPSRASILTGDYSHTTGVYRQSPPFGRFEWFRDGSTLATWLDAAGYTTGFFGKYLDGYQHAALTGYVPPGWDRWVAFVHAAYYGYKLTVDGEIRTHGTAPGDHSTSVLAREAVSFIRDARGPLFLYLAPAAPHAPAIPAPADEEAFPDLEPWRPPAFDEADVSDKPSWVRALAPLSVQATGALDDLRRDQYRSLLGVDRAVGEIVSALRATGRLANTLIVYTSDNGLAWGEHRWTKKEAPYEEVIRVPMVVRWDAAGLATGSGPTELVLNVDIAPTIVEATGVEAAPMDGRSLLPLLRGDGPWDRRRDFLVEHLAGTNPIPTYCAVRSTRWTYVRYTDGEEELYDLASDPAQLRNLTTDPRTSAALERMRERLEALCEPPPPGYLEDGLDPRVLLACGLLLLLFTASALRSRRAVTKPNG